MDVTCTRLHAEMRGKAFLDNRTKLQLLKVTQADE
jgi:hypothetical protein